MKKLFTKNVMVTALLAVLFFAGIGLVLAVEGEGEGSEAFDLNNSQIVYLTVDPNGPGSE